MLSVQDHVDIAWNPPADDGGSPIEEYIIEKKDKNGRWEEAMTVPGGGQTAASVKGLTPGEEYQFRVTAKNKAGPGDPSEPTDPVIAKPRHCELMTFWKFIFVYRRLY